MLVKTHHVKGFEDFRNFVRNYESKKTLFILFIGTRLPNGKSWCRDCVIGIIAVL